MAKAVTKKQSTAVMPFNFAKDAGSGMEHVDRDSFAIPFLKVLQKGSPQCDAEKMDAAYNPKAKPGMLLNTVTGKLVPGKTGVIFLPCAFQRRFIQWGPRKLGGGFKGEHMPEDIAQLRLDEKVSELDGKLYLIPEAPNEKKHDQLVDTRTHFGIVVDEEDGSCTQVIFPLSSTQIKKSKQLMSMLAAARIRGITPPTWMSRIRITTVPESNDQGSWHGVRFEADGFVKSKELYAAGKDFYTIIAEGAAYANLADSEEDSESGTTF